MTVLTYAVNSKNVALLEFSRGQFSLLQCFVTEEIDKCKINDKEKTEHFGQHDI